MQSLEEAIGRYNEAWNDHDLDAIMSMHAPDMVFETTLRANRLRVRTSARSRSSTSKAAWIRRRRISSPTS